MKSDLFFFSPKILIYCKNLNMYSLENYQRKPKQSFVIRNITCSGITNLADSLIWLKSWGKLTFKIICIPLCLSFYYSPHGTGIVFSHPKWWCSDTMMFSHLIGFKIYWVPLRGKVCHKIWKKSHRAQPHW